MHDVEMNDLVKRLQCAHDGRGAVVINAHGECLKAIWSHLAYYHSFHDAAFDEIGSAVWYKTIVDVLISTLPDLEIAVIHGINEPRVRVRSEWCEWREWQSCQGQLHYLECIVHDAEYYAQHMAISRVREEINKLVAADLQEEGLI